jgi:P27 family predicted phage terminase small subunit
MKGRKPNVVEDAAALPAVPRAPTWFSKDAKAEWRRVMPLLIERKILTDADLGCTENYCLAIGRVREFEKAIQRTGVTELALVRAQDKAMQTARQLAAELGLTPVSRSRPTVRDGANDAELDFLG